MSAGLAIYDTMQYIRPEVHTMCMGQAASMGSLLLAGGAPGHRYALPNAKIMLHQPSGGAQGMASDIAIQAEEILKTRSKLNDLYVGHTGQPLGEASPAPHGPVYFPRTPHHPNAPLLPSNEPDGRRSLTSNYYYHHHHHRHLAATTHPHSPLPAIHRPCLRRRSRGY